MQSSTTSRSRYLHLHDLNDKIRILQQQIDKMKECLMQVDITLHKIKLKNRLNILEKLIFKQKQQFQQLQLIYSLIRQQQRKTYSEIIRTFKDKMLEQKQQVQQALTMPQEHQQRINTKKSLWSQEEQQQQSSILYYCRGALGIFGAFCLHLLIGSIFRWSMINRYVTSYYKITNDPYITTSQNGIGGPLSMFFVGISMRWGFRTCQQYGAIKILTPTVILLVLNIYIASLMPSFILFILFNNCFYALCAGILFLQPMRQCHLYFPGGKLLVNGIILVGTGLGSVFFGCMNTECMNKEQFQPETSGYFAGDLDYIARRMPNCIAEMWFMLAIVGVLGILTLYPIIKYNLQQQELLQSTGTRMDFEFICHTEQEAVNSPVFWVIALLILLSSSGNFFIFNNYQNLVHKNITNTTFLSLVLTFGAIGNGFFRLFWVLLFRKAGFKVVALILMIINIITFSVITTSLDKPQLYLIVFTINGIVLGGYMVLFPNVSLLVFGELVGESIYGYYWAVFALSNFFQYFIGLYTDSSSGFFKIFVIFIILCSISIIICLKFKFQGKWQNQMKLLQIPFVCQNDC